MTPTTVLITVVAVLFAVGQIGFAIARRETGAQATVSRTLSWILTGVAAFGAAMIFI